MSKENYRRAAPYALTAYQTARKHGFQGNEREFVRQMLYGVLPEPPDADGTYTLELIVADGRPMYIWAPQ